MPAAEAPSESALGQPPTELSAEVGADAGNMAGVAAAPAPPAPESGAGGGPESAAAAGPARAQGESAPGEAGEGASSDRRRRDREAKREADRELARTRRQLGLALEGAGDIEGAVSEFEAALAAPWPASGKSGETPWDDLARICRRAEPAAAVARACTGALNPGRYPPAILAEFLANRGDAHARLGRTELALTDYAGALKIESNNFRALIGRARLMVAGGHPEQALNNLRLAISTGPRPAEARLVRARAWRALGDPERAVADYDAVLADLGATPWHPAAWRGRGAAHCAMGRAEAAAADWQVWADSVSEGHAYLQEMLRARDYLRGPWEAGLGPATLAGLRAWTREGCP